MVFATARKTTENSISFQLRFFLTILLVLTLFLNLVPAVYADPPPQPTPTTPMGDNPTWEYSAEVTEVGKNAERARELLWWVWTHPPLYNHPALAQTWGASIKIAVLFMVFIIIAFGFGLIITRGKGTVGPIFNGISSPFAGATMQSIFFKLFMVIVYIAASYLIVLGLIQVGEISMGLIKDLAGGDLFNVIFAGSGNIEDNYVNFMGFKDTNSVNWEMVNTSLFLIRFTSFTYNVMSIMLILRAVILWFMLILSPFLAFLMPFIFIRNTGWIWIGVFFQWLFYGPLMTLFLVSTTKIWVLGIPFQFAFGRVDKPEGQIYKTAINILYGGPAQVISPGNSANYVDTYAEYVIALVMLWAAIILPWWLLRIFRDYCCEAIASGNATLTAMFDRFRQYPPPPPPSTPPPTKTTIAVELPFRETVKEKIKEIEKTRIEEIRTKEISEYKTDQIAHAFKLAVGSLADVSNLEMNKLKRAELKQNLDKIASPEKIASANERQRYETLKNELQGRALVGDTVAQAILTASEQKKEGSNAQIALMAGVRSVATPVKSHGVYAPTAPVSTPTIHQVAGPKVQQNIVQSVAKQSDASESIVRSILQSISTADLSHLQMVATLAQQLGLSETKVKEVVDKSVSEIISNKSSLENIANQSVMSVEKVKETLAAIQTVGIPSSQIITRVAEKTGVSEIKIHDLLGVVSSSVAVNPQMVKNIADKTNVSQGVVMDVLQNLTKSNISGSEVIALLAKKYGVSEAKIQEIITIARSSAGSVSVPNVSVEDYEEVKSMWLKHYQDAPVPVTEDIKTRADWLISEEKKLNNVSNLLASSDPAMKQQGLEQVAELLPFMLLGGFSQSEIMTYIKAKVEAAKQVKEQLEMVEKVLAEEKEKAKEEEETLLEVKDKKEEEVKHAHLAQEQKMELPKDKKDESTAKTPSVGASGKPSEKPKQED